MEAITMEQSTYYKLPLNLDAIFSEDHAEIGLCTEVESVDQHIELIITTCPGEHKFNKNFGCRIWDMDFELVVSRKKWEEEFSAAIKTAVETFEQRIKNVDVTIHVMEVTREDRLTKTTAIKKIVDVSIKGKLISTQYNCVFKYRLFLGPLATE